MSKLPKDVLFYGLRSKMTEEQEDLVEAILSDDIDIVFCNASAGTGKTVMSVAASKLLVEQNKKDGLLYVFTPVEESKMGFRPGSQVDKERDYTMPLRQALVEINEQPDRVIIESEDYIAMKSKTRKQWVEASSHTFARGTNQTNKIVIIDEAQNFTHAELKKMLTRCHDNCKVIVIGHDGQIDLDHPKSSGFKDNLNHFKDMPRSKACELTHNFRGWLAQHADSLSS